MIFPFACRSLLLVCMICVCTGFAHAQIQVDLFPVFGYGPFGQRSVAAFPPRSEDHLEVKGIPDEVIEHMIVVHNLQPFQLLHNRYLRGETTQAQYEKLMGSWGIDSSAVTDAEVDQQLVALVGSNQDGEIVVILDADNDEDFSNEIIHLFPPPMPNASLEQEAQPSPRRLIQQIEYEWFNGKEIEQKSVIVSFSPDKGNVSIKSDNPLHQKYYLDFSIPLYRTGITLLNGKEYAVAISNGFSGEYFFTPGFYGASMIIWDADSAWKSQAEGNIPYKVGEVFTLNNHLQYEFTSIDKWGKSAVITFVGETDRPEGYTDNFFAPGFTGLTLAEDTISIENFRGSYVLLDFWGTWCAPCIEGIPDLKKIHTEYAPKGLQMVGIAAQESSREAVKEFVEKREMPWMHTYELLSRNHDPALHSPQTATHRYKIVSYPTFILIDPEGKILFRTSRMIELEEFLKKISM